LARQIFDFQRRTLFEIMDLMPLVNEHVTYQLSEALRRVVYPGYDADIVTLGIVEEITAIDGGVAVTLRQGGAREDVIHEVARQVRELLSRELKLVKVEVAVRRLEPELGERTGRVALEGVRYVIAVASGKGGVGKSTVAANLAAGLSRLGYRVGLLDADIYGPSVPLMFGTGGARPQSAGEQRFYPVERYGISLISIGMFLTERAPVIWRGPMVMGAVRQFLKDTVWQSRDFLVVDLPPGTGDAPLTLAQQVCLDGALIVTTPQDVAVLDAQRALKMLRQVHCPLLGVVENMSYFVCPDCGELDEIFGHGGGERIARNENLKLLSRLPIYAHVREAGDSGIPITLGEPEHPASRAFLELAREVAAQVESRMQRGLPQ
jgi:ATP-binding protein involved in chromosome partitioning